MTNSTDPARAKPPKVFISYAREDRALCEELLEHIGWLRYSGQLDVFDDFQIKPTQEWNKEIFIKLSEADIVICLISAAFVGSRFCTVHEMSRAINWQIPILPILLRDVDFEALPVSRFQALPVDANGRLRPISRWRGRSGRDQAWSRVAQALRIAISQISTTEDARSIVEKEVHNDPQINDSHEDEIEHIWWKIDENYTRIKEEISGIPLIYYLPTNLISIPALRLEIDRAILDIREVMLRESIDSDSHYFVSGAFEATFIGERFISMRAYFRMFFGGAHSAYEFRAITFDLLTRKAIGLGDLLKLRSQYDAVVGLVAKRLSAERRRRSSEQTMRDDGQWLPCRPDDLCFCLVGESSQLSVLQYIKFMFAPYDIGSFAEGPYEFDIPVVSFVEVGTPLLREICDLPPLDIQGRYVRTSEFAPAFVNVIKEGDGSVYHVKGEAYWGADRFYGPNMGALDFRATSNGSELTHKEVIGDKEYICRIRFRNSSIDVEESYGMHGHNVSFTGKYSREFSDDGDVFEDDVNEKEDKVSEGFLRRLSRIIKIAHKKR